MKVSWTEFPQLCRLGIGLHCGLVGRGCLARMFSLRWMLVGKDEVQCPLDFVVVVVVVVVVVFVQWVGWFW